MRTSTIKRAAALGAATLIGATALFAAPAANAATGNNSLASVLGVGDKAAESLLGRARAAFRELIMELAGSADALEPPRH